MNSNKCISAVVKSLISWLSNGKASEELPLKRVLLWSNVAEITIQILGWVSPNKARIRASVYDERLARTHFTGYLNSEEMPSENGLRGKVWDEALDPLSCRFARVGLSTFCAVSKEPIYGEPNFRSARMEFDFSLNGI